MNFIFSREHISFIFPNEYWEIMLVLIIPNWILFSKTVLVKIWSIAVALFLVTPTGLWIRDRNTF